MRTGRFACLAGRLNQIHPTSVPVVGGHRTHQLGHLWSAPYVVVHMDMDMWIPIAIGTAIASIAAIMFLFHPVSAVPVRRRLKWLSCFLVGVGGLILAVLLPAGLAWGHLYVRGVSVQAEVV